LGVSLVALALSVGAIIAQLVIANELLTPRHAYNIMLKWRRSRHTNQGLLMESRDRLIGTISAIAILLSGCGSGSARYPSASSADEPHEELCADENARISMLEDQLEEARMQLDALEQRKSQLQSAADNLRNNVDRLGLENWRDVVPDIDSSASEVEDEASQMDSELSEAADVLEDR